MQGVSSRWSPFNCIDRGRGLVHHAQPPAKVEFGECFRRASLGVLATLKLDFRKKFARPKSQCERDGLRRVYQGLPLKIRITQPTPQTTRQKPQVKPYPARVWHYQDRDHRSDATDLIQAVHCRVAGGKRITPSFEDLWATRQFDASPISVSMRIVAVAPPNAEKATVLLA